MSDILHRIGIKSSPDKVYRALTEQAFLANWWTKTVTAEPEVGHVNIFKFGDLGELQLKVTELVPKERVKWESVGGVEDWIGSTITFSITPHEKGAYVDFVHGGFKSKNCAHCSTKWGMYLLSLKGCCEVGKGRPFPTDIPIDI